MCVEDVTDCLRRHSEIQRHCCVTSRGGDQLGQVSAGGVRHLGLVRVPRRRVSGGGGGEGFRIVGVLSAVRQVRKQLNFSPNPRTALNEYLRKEETVVKNAEDKTRGRSTKEKY